MTAELNLITGSCGYVGHAVAAAFCASGQTVIGADRLPPVLSHASYSHVRADLSTAAGVSEVISYVLSTGAGVRRLIHCAALYERTELPDLTFEMSQRTFAVNVSSAVALVSGLVTQLKCAPSYVVFLASDAAMLGPKRGAHYAASKGACISAVYSIARAFADRGIIAFSIVPGVLDSPQAQTEDPLRRDKFIREIPQGRLGTARDVVDVVRAVTSGAFDYCSGQQFVVNGARNLL